MIKKSQMKKILFIGLFLSFFLACGQKDIQGTWLLTHIEAKAKQRPVYALVEFKENGKFLINNVEVADWEKQKNQLIFHSKIKPKLDGKAQIISANSQKFVYQFKNTKYYFERYDTKSIYENPLYQQLLGTWQMEGSMVTIFDFEKNNRLMVYETYDNAETTTGTSWFLIPRDSSLIITAKDLDVLGGRSKIIEINKNFLELKNNDINYQLYRIPRIEKPKEQLTFTYEDIENGTGDIYDLPWSDEAYFGFLKTVDYLQYYKRTYKEEVHAYLCDDIISKVNVDENKQEIRFTDYLIKEEEEIKINEVVKGSVKNRYNRFFPQKDISPFRLVNNFEKINIEDEDYYCTVVEGFDGDTKVKYWMVNDMPGVFAKIIVQNDGDFLTPYYYIQEWVPFDPEEGNQD